MRVVVCSDIEAPRQMVWDYIVDPDRDPEVRVESRQVS
jgi:hypothetical protein